MPTPPLQTQDFWRVNSYGYPNRFNRDSKAQEAWATLLSFYDFDGRSYSDLKEFWSSPHAPRKLDSHAVESWKATFEEFGLLYVISRSDRITITPAGQQFRNAADHDDNNEFVWIGLNLLLRYPLHGPPRGRAKSPAHAQSDLLVYRFVFSSLRDLADYFWWTELERILCRVFFTWEAPHAVDAVREIRSNPTRHESFALPIDRRRGAFYNSLNQVANHAGMNHLILVQDDGSEHYGPNESRRRHFIDRRYLSIIGAALGDRSSPDGCAGTALYIERLPTAPALPSEVDYFDYLGAKVPNFSTATTAATPHTITFAGDTVFLLKITEHYNPLPTSSPEILISGSPFVLCHIARNHRIILSEDMAWTYLVVDKAITGPDRVTLSIRRARPITNPQPLHEIFGGENA